MKNRRLILKKESFGGIFVDTAKGRRQFLKPNEYEPKKQELMQTGDNFTKVQIIDVTEKGYPLLDNASSSPNSIFWELTKKCNGACTECFMDSNSAKWNKPESTFAQIEDIAVQFISLGGSSVRLTGGEPTQRADFFDIVDMLNEAGMEVGLNTNGMFNENKLEQILSRGIKDIRISLDGPQHLNDKIRWPGNYMGAVETIKKIAEFNKTAQEPTSPTINVVLMKSTIPYMEEMVELAHEHGFKISFGLMRLSGRADRNDMLSPEEVVQAAYKAEELRTEFALPGGTIRINYDIFCGKVQDGKGKEIQGYAPFPFDNSKCPLGTYGFNIDAYGRIAPCGYVVNEEKLMGEDIRGKDMLQVWHNSPMLKIIREITREECSDCSYHKTRCNGGCPAMAYLIDGNMEGKDPYCVRNVDIKKILIKNQEQRLK